MEVAWMTDPHFDHCSERVRQELHERVRDSGADEVWITGDIATARTRALFLDEFCDSVALPVRYVLGNHDFWGCEGSVKDEQDREFIHSSSAQGFYLGDSERRLVWNHGRSALLGSDGFADARWVESLHRFRYVMRDWSLIPDLAVPARLFGAIGAAEAARPIADRMSAALERAVDNLLNGCRLVETLWILTHIPPWRTAATHEGQPCDAAHLPWFTSMATGDVIEDVAIRYPGVEFRVLCGHTHSKNRDFVASNVTCLTGGSAYGQPSWEMIEV